MEPAWSPHGATNRTGTLRSAAPACPPGGTPHTIAVSCHRRDGQLVYAGKSFFLLFLFPPQHLCRDRSHRGRWLNSRCYLFLCFLIKTSDTLVRESSNPWINEVLEDVERSLCRCFLLMALRCSRAALLTAVLLDAEQLQHTQLGVCIMLHHSCSWRIDRAALFQNDVNL